MAKVKAKKPGSESTIADIDSKISHGATRPDNLAISKCVDLAQGNLKILLYIKQNHDAIVEHFDCAEESEVAMTAISDTIAMAEYVHKEREGLEEKIRNGTITKEELDVLRHDYFNFQDLLTRQKIQEIDKDDLNEAFKNVVMIYDINDKSEFVRGYVSNGKQLNPEIEKDKKVIDVLDQAFHSWLVTNGMSSDAGVIYNKDKIDKQGHFTERASPEKVASLLDSPQKGLDATIKKQSQELSLKIQRNQQNPEAEQTIKADSNL